MDDLSTKESIALVLAAGSQNVNYASQSTTNRRSDDENDRDQQAEETVSNASKLAL